MKNNNKKIKVNDSSSELKLCTLCNPKIYLKFSFAFITYEKEEAEDYLLAQMWKRMRWMSQEPYINMFYTYCTKKQRWFELIPTSQINKKIPNSFREIFPTETNEKFAVMRVYPSGSPNGTANPRIIGMIKHTVFYIFFLDWKGELYNH